MLVVTVVDRARDEAVVPALALALRERLHVGQHLRARATRGGQGEVARQVAVGLGRAADVAHQLVVLGGDAVAEDRQALRALEQLVERALAEAAKRSDRAVVSQS